MYIVEYKRYSTLSYIIFPAGRDKAVAQRGYGKRGHMTTKECYELMGADYEDVLGRLMTEKLVKKFLYKFADAKDMEELKTSLEAKDYNTAFRMAHNLKGVCANLSITRLGASSSELCEELRDGNYSDKVEPLLAAVLADYEATLEAIKKLQAEEG